MVRGYGCRSLGNDMNILLKKERKKKGYGGNVDDGLAHCA
jgi:hypothetical protein